MINNDVILELEAWYDDIMEKTGEDFVHRFVRENELRFALARILLPKFGSSLFREKRPTHCVLARDNSFDLVVALDKDRWQYATELKILSKYISSPMNGLQRIAQDLIRLASLNAEKNVKCWFILAGEKQHFETLTNPTRNKLVKILLPSSTNYVLKRLINRNDPFREILQDLNRSWKLVGNYADRLMIPDVRPVRRETTSTRDYGTTKDPYHLGDRRLIIVAWEVVSSRISMAEAM